MLFNSLSFILLFLPACLALYYAAARLDFRAAAMVLVVFSLLFYSWTDPALLLLIGFSMAYNYLFGLGILRTEDRPRLQNAVLVVAVTGDILLLVYFKYLYPFLAWLDTLGLHIPRDRTSVILPLGISFFTFTQIGFLIDSKAGITKDARLKDYLLFVTFFPHLIAGPILHHREMMPQFADPRTYRFKFDTFCVGVAIFIVGLLKKDLIADHFAPLANTAFSAPNGLGVAAAWGGVLSYTLQLYYDFSGYSEMAVGLALMFGVRFPANFNSPYKARSIIDFWQRWHMTLTRYITLYLYNPVALSITRRRMARGMTTGRKAASSAGGFASTIAFPLFVTMGIAGVWHGAGLQYVCFGLLHAGYLTVNHAWRTWGPKKGQQKSVVRQTVDGIWMTALTLLAVIAAQIFFRSASAPDALMMLKDMAGMGTPPVDPAAAFAAPDVVEKMLRSAGHDLQPVLNGLNFGAPLTLLLLFAWVFVMPNILQVTDAYKPTLTKFHLGIWQRVMWRPSALWGGIFGLLAAIAILAITGTTEFLYFQF
jgi:alginate O-acetyltransferase complex protein AlgI